MNEEISQSRYVTLPGDPNERDDSGRVTRFMGSLAGGVIYALAAVVGSVVAAVITLTLLTLLVVEIAERMTGVTI